MMSWSPIEIRETPDGSFEAEIRGDTLISGDNGYWVQVTGWGPDEATARANLKAAVGEAQKTPER